MAIKDDDILNFYDFAKIHEKYTAEEMGSTLKNLIGNGYHVVVMGDIAFKELEHLVKQIIAEDLFFGKGVAVKRKPDKQTLLPA